MNMPRGYKEAQVDWQPVTPGGHRCVIREVQEVKSSTGKDMLRISYDMHQSDTQPLYFSSQYVSDQRAGKTGDRLKWKGTSLYYVDSGEDFGTRNLKAFNTAFLDSNPEAGVMDPEGKRDVIWGDGYAAQFKNKLIGIIFRQEEYTKDDGTLGVSVKPMRYCSFEKALGQPVPERKRLKEQQPLPPAPPSDWANFPTSTGTVSRDQLRQATQDGFTPYQQQSFGQYQQPPMAQAMNEAFMQPDPLNDEGLPFN